MHERAVCPIDATPLATPQTGRPPTFCSVACRRVAESELRRITTRLGRLEEDRDRLEMRIATADPHYPAVVKAHRQELTATDAAIAKAVERQRLLFERLSDNTEGDTDGSAR
jgi:sugar-specific transcriptional regulator TrmB